MKQIIDGKMYKMKDAPTNTLEERIQRMEDTEAIKEIMYNYCYSADNMDGIGMSACFSETGIMSMGDVYPTKYHGREAIAKFYEGKLDEALTSSHYITNMQIWFETPDSAIMVAYVYAWKRFRDYPNTSDFEMYGSYETQAVRNTDGEWRFESLKLVVAGMTPGNRVNEQHNRPWPPVPNK